MSHPNTVALLAGFFLAAAPRAQSDSISADQAARRLIGITAQEARAEPASIAFHPAFRPRGEARATPAGELAAPIPRRWPAEAESEDSDDHRDRWLERGSPLAYAQAAREAVAVPDYPNFLDGGAWTEIGNGIYGSGANNFHRTGRVACAAYAHDFHQGMTTLFLGSMGGGLWRYDWGKNRWLSVSASLSGSPAVGAFLVDPNDARHILIGSGDGWRYQGSGLYRSTDGGVTWARCALNPMPDSFTEVRVDYANRYAFLASTNKGIYRSDNRGGTWRQVWAGQATDLVQDPVYPSFWYAAQRGGRVLESYDGGRRFHPIGTGITGTIGRVSLAVCDAAPNYVYALVEGAGGSLNNVYRSPNYGYNWTPIDTADVIGWGQAFHTCAIAVDPRDPDVVMAGMGGFQFTENATASRVGWTKYRQPGHADYTSFTFIPSGWAPSNTWVLITSDGGYCTYDYRANRFYTDGNLNGLNVGQVWVTTHGLAQSPIVGTELLSGTQDNGVVRIDVAKPGSLAIQYAAGGDGGTVSYSRNNRWECLATVGGPPFARWWSGNAGLTFSRWIDDSLPQHSVPSLLYHPDPTSTTILTNDTKGYLYYKLTHGFPPIMDPWRTANPNGRLPVGIAAFDMAAQPGVQVYCAGNDGHVYALTSGSFAGSVSDLRYSRRTPPLPAGWTSGTPVVTADRFPTRASTVYYATAGVRPSRVYRSTTHAAWWVDCTGNLTTLLPDASYFELVALPTNSDVMFLASNVGVFRSDNHGTTWFRYMDGMPAVVDVRDLEIVLSGSTPMLRIATNGRGWWQRVVE